MHAWWIARQGPIDGNPLERGERADPTPAAHEILVRVSVCGVCRTDLHLAEGDLAAHRPNTVPGHEAVGVVVGIGADVTRFAVGERVGVAWLRSTCGRCRFCRAGAENLCLTPLFTGWDADGGFADLTVVDEAYAYAMPDCFGDAEAAPLLCAGIIGYRALRRAQLPPGGRLGIYGFGASAHLAAQVATAQGADVHVFTRSRAARRLALDLGASSAGDVDDPTPVPLDSAILFAPAGELVPIALRALDRGGTLAVAGIYLTDTPPMHYATELFQERNLRSVTANTRRDGEEFLTLAAKLGIRPSVTIRGFSELDAALRDLSHDRVTGATVIDIAG